MGRCVVGCEQCSHPTTQRPTTATNHIQQNQSSIPYAVTHGLGSPEDGHNDTRNMLRQKLIINIWMLHLVGFLSLHTLLTMHGHRNLKYCILSTAWQAQEQTKRGRINLEKLSIQSAAEDVSSRTCSSDARYQPSLCPRKVFHEFLNRRFHVNFPVPANAGKES